MLGELIKQESFWGIIGVIVGFLLGEGSRLVRYKCRLRRLKAMIRDELQSIRSQIPYKVDILQQMQGALHEGALLSGMSVSALDIGWRQHGAELYAHLSLKERNCLHVIYERLRIADALMASFDSDFRAAKTEGLLHEPTAAFGGRLKELQQSYKVVDDLVGSYLIGKATDVFRLDNR